MQAVICCCWCRFDYYQSQSSVSYKFIIYKCLIMVLILFKIGLYHILIMQFPIVIMIYDIINVFNSCTFLSNNKFFLIYCIFCGGNICQCNTHSQLLYFSLIDFHSINFKTKTLSTYFSGMFMGIALEK